MQCLWKRVTESLRESLVNTYDTTYVGLGCCCRGVEGASNYSVLGSE